MRLRAKKTPKQTEMHGLSGWGGKRKSAGRKNRTQTVNHMKRERFDDKKPLQITMKLKTGLKSLRTKRMHSAFQRSLEKAKQHGLRVIHYTLEGNHFHLFVECRSANQLGRAMKSFGSSFGKAVRRIEGGVGGVFNGRFHLSVLKNPTLARNSLRYVLLNRFKHENSHPDDNEFSSGKYFSHWRKLLGRGKQAEVKEVELPGYLAPPRSWLAREGWMRAA